MGARRVVVCDRQSESQWIRQLVSIFTHGAGESVWFGGKKAINRTTAPSTSALTLPPTSPSDLLISQPHHSALLTNAKIRPPPERSESKKEKK